MDESRRILIFDGRHEISTNKAVDNVHHVHTDHQHQQSREHESRPTTNIGSNEIGDGTYQTYQGLLVDGSLFPVHLVGL
jgi:hypothetical protein